jgi:hypothetical protein
MPQPKNTEIVIVKLPIASDGAVARLAPMMVFPEDRPDDAERARVYDNEPSIVAQLDETESQARFEAEWDGRGWSLYGRV